jgi:hypothetical protein
MGGDYLLTVWRIYQPKTVRYASKSGKHPDLPLRHRVCCDKKSFEPETAVEWNLECVGFVFGKA